MHFQTFPTPRAWKRHTGRAHQVGLSAGALACLGTEPHAHADPASFTGYIGTVKDSVAMTRSPLASSPPKRSARAAALWQNHGISSSTSCTYRSRSRPPRNSPTPNACRTSPAPATASAPRLTTPSCAPPPRGPRQGRRPSCRRNNHALPGQIPNYGR